MSRLDMDAASRRPAFREVALDGPSGSRVGSGPASYLVTTEQRVWLDADGQPRGSVPLNALSGLAGIGQVTVLGRLVPTGQSREVRLFADPVNSLLVEAPGTILRQLMELSRLAIMARRAMRRGDRLIAYLPGIVSLVPVVLAMLMRRPFAVVVVGDPSEALSPDVVPGTAARIARFVITGVQRLACRRAAVARYVTDRALQRAYPPGARTRVTALSDVMIGQVEEPRSSPQLGGALHVITVASLDRPYKGVSELMQAVKIARDSGCRTSLTVVGGGAMQSALESEAERTLGTGFDFRGQVPPSTVHKLLREADVFALASWTEGQPRALLEAMAAGLPVLATSVGGVPDIVPSNYVVPPRCPEALAEALIRLGSDGDEYRDQARHSHEVAQGLVSDRQVERQTAFIEDIGCLHPRSADSARDSPIRVLHVFGAMDVGGAETRAIEMMRQLTGKGIEFHFLTLSGRKGALAPVIEQAGGRIHPLSLSPTFPWKFRQLVMALDVDVIDSHVATFSGALMLIAKLCGVPTRIARMHSTGDAHGDSVRRRIQRHAMRRLIARHATHILGVSPAALSDGYDDAWDEDARCAVVPNGVDVGRLWSESDFSLRGHLGIAESDVICLHVGRASPEKNRERIPRIIAALRAHGVPAWGILVGPPDDVDEAKVRQATAAAGMTGWVHIFGEREDVGALLREADLLLQPSRREGLPGTVLEALAVGTPVLSSSVPGSTWIAEHFAAIRCLPLGMGDDAWAAAAVELLSAPRDNEERVRTAFQASPFSLDRAASTNEILYREARLP